MALPSPQSGPTGEVEPPLDYRFLLNLSEDEVWSARKSLLRKYFLALQSYARDPQAVTAQSTQRLVLRPVQPNPLPLLLRLPPEILAQIASHLLTASSSPVRGPHPRTLQTPLTLTCRFPPASLLICQQLHSIFLPVFYGSSNPIQEVSIKIDYNVWHHRLNRSTLALSASVRKSLHYLHITIFLGSEKKNNLPSKDAAAARLEVVKKGVRKLAKWVEGVGTRIRGLRISWFEPPSTITWNQKREILDLLKVLRSESVEVGTINWNLRYPGGKYAFKERYLKELEWRGEDGNDGEEEN